MKKNSGKSLLSGLLFGALVGTAYSMMFAQKKGSTLRKELKDKSANPKQVVDAVVSEYGKAGKETGKVVREFLASEQAKEVIGEFKSSLGPLLSRLQEQGDVLTGTVQEFLAKGQGVFEAAVKMRKAKKAPAKASSKPKAAPRRKPSSK